VKHPLFQQKDLFGKSFGTKMLSAYATMSVGKDFLCLVRSQILDKWCDETHFVQDSFH